MKDILKTLVEIPTVSNNLKANKQALDYIADFLSTRNMFVARHSFNGHESIVATTQNTKTPTLMLSGHIDVVDADPQLFKLVQKDGYFYGRGVIDMKFGIAAFLQLVDDLNDNLKNYDFGIMITSDEEIGGQNGTKKLLEEGYVPKVCLVPDGGKNWAIEKFAKGITWFTITMPGKSTHSSRPWDGENALDKLLMLLAEIKKLLPKDSPNASTLALSQLHAGQATNQVPDKAEARLDGRFLSLQDQQSTKDKIAALCKKYGATLEMPIDDPYYQNDLSSEYIKTYINVAQKTLGHKIDIIEAQGASDARYFGKMGVPCIVTYPPGGDYHSPNEHLHVEGFYQFYDVLKNYVNKVANLDFI